MNNEETPNSLVRCITKLKISARSIKFGPQVYAFPCIQGIPQNVIPVSWYKYFMIRLHPLVNRG